MSKNEPDEYLEMAIAFGDPARFSAAKKRIKKQVADNKRFYPENIDPLAELAESSAADK